MLLLDIWRLWVPPNPPPGQRRRAASPPALPGRACVKSAGRPRSSTEFLTSLLLVLLGLTLLFERLAGLLGGGLSRRLVGHVNPLSLLRPYSVGPIHYVGPGLRVSCPRSPGRWGSSVSEQSPSQLLVGRWVLVLPGMLVRQSGMASLTRWRGDLTSETQHSEEEESDPVWAFAQLRRLGFGLVTVSHPNLVRLIRITRRSAHPSNDTGERFCRPLFRPSAGCHRTPARSVCRDSSEP
jgi:hypothetical protein